MAESKGSQRSDTDKQPADTEPVDLTELNARIAKEAAEATRAPDK